VRSKRRITDRQTVKFYTYGKESFWRHTAAEISFRLAGQTWFLQIVPKYFFTEDGITPWDSDKLGEYTTQIKADETNHHVLNHVLFWADVLSRANPPSNNPEEIVVELDLRKVMVIDKLPISGVAAFAIPYDPATFEEPPDNQLSFVSWFDQLKGDSDDD
jgi:hypothetical protein